MQKDNVTTVLKQLVKELGIPVTKKTLEKEMELHPDYFSLLSISDLLDNWNVPNAAYELSFEDLLTTEMPESFVAYFATKEFVWINSFSDAKIIVSNEKWRKHELTLEEFRVYYGGSVLIAEKNEDSGEVDYDKNHRQELIENWTLPLVILAAMCMLIAALAFHSSYFSTFSLKVALLTVLKTAGMVTTVLLLIQSIDTNNPLVQKLCGGDDKRNCNAILSSKAAKLSTNISWSEFGFYYFAGTWLVLLFNSDHPNIMNALAFMNIISLPYTFYSIYYQWRIARQWCIFCCAVQAILWLEFITFIFLFKPTFSIPKAAELSSLFIGLALPVLAWLIIRPFLMLFDQILPLKQELRRFKFNTMLFGNLLDGQKRFDLVPEVQSLMVGSSDAKNIVTMVSNPYCQPCAKAHKMIDDLLDHSANVKVQVIFSTANNENDPKTTAAKHLLSLQYRYDQTQLKNALNDWYERQSIKGDWTQKHSYQEVSGLNEILKLHKEWCDLTDITGTPTIFINGRRLPEPYKLSDMKYLLQ